MRVFALILKIRDSRPRAYKIMDCEHPCLTDLSILKLGVKVSFTRNLDSISV